MKMLQDQLPGEFELAIHDEFSEAKQRIHDASDWLYDQIRLLNNECAALRVQLSDISHTADTLKEENQSLAESAKLVDIMRRDNEDLHEQVAEAQEKNLRLISQVTEETGMVVVLSDRNAELERQHLADVVENQRQYELYCKLSNEKDELVKKLTVSDKPTASDCGTSDFGACDAPIANGSECRWNAFETACGG